MTVFNVDMTFEEYCRYLEEHPPAEDCKACEIEVNDNDQKRDD